MQATALVPEPDESEVQLLSLDRIEVLPDALQSRAKTDMTVVRKFAEAMRRGAEFPPVIVYETPDARLLLSDGFHRHEATKRCRSRSIRAVVRRGTLTDALLGGIAENMDQEHFRLPKDEDQRRIVELLIRHKETRDWSNMEIARRSRLSQGTVRKIRARLRESEGIDIPITVKTFGKDGKPTGDVRPYARNKAGHLAISKQALDRRLVTRVDGRVRYLSNDQEKARELFDQIQTDRAASEKALSSAARFSRWLTERDFAHRSISLSVSPVGGYCSLDGRIFYLPVSKPDCASLISAIGRLTIIRACCQVEGRCIIVCYRKRVNQLAARIIAKSELIGIEFMSPEDMVAEFGAKPDGGVA